MSRLTNATFALPRKRRWIPWPLKTDRDKIYIVPTGAGAFFVGTTLVMLLVGSGYSNNLVNILAFFMFSLVFVSMVVTQSQLKGIAIEDLEILPSFSTGEATIAAHVRNPHTQERWGIEVRLPEVEAPESGPHLLKAQQVSRITWARTSGIRGHFQLKRVEVHSVYPLGLFHAWKVLKAETFYYIYPRLHGELPMPSHLREGAGETHEKISLSGGDDFKGHRRFVEGDSARQVDWKAYARGRPLLIKEINEGEPPDLVFEWEALEGAGLSDEEKLSQITVWVREAQQRSLNFAMKIPGTELAGKGNEHANRCLVALAQWRNA